MGKAFAVGERQFILGFKGVGFEIIPVSEPAKLLRELQLLLQDKDIALILLTESIAESCESLIEEFREKTSAIIAVIPTHEGAKHLSFNSLQRMVERSLGVDILGKQQ